MCALCVQRCYYLCALFMANWFSCGYGNLHNFVFFFVFFGFLHQIRIAISFIFHFAHTPHILQMPNVNEKWDFRFEIEFVHFAHRKNRKQTYFFEIRWANKPFEDGHACWWNRWDFVVHIQQNEPKWGLWVDAHNIALNGAHSIRGLFFIRLQIVQRK